MIETKPSNSSELDIAVRVLIAAFECMNGAIDPEKNFDVFVERIDAINFKVVFGYITNIKPVPPMVNPADVETHTPGEYSFKWSTSESLKRLVQDVESAYDHIQAIQLY